MEASWVFIPSGLPLLDDVAGQRPFDILERLWNPLDYLLPGKRRFLLEHRPSRDSNVEGNPDESDFSSFSLNF